MDELQRILVVLTGAKSSQLAVERALALAERHGAKLTFVDVYPYLDSYLEALAEIMPEDELRHLMLDERRDQLQRQLQAYGMPQTATTEVKILDGIPFVEIIREVLRSRHDLIIKVAETENDGHERLLGSTDMHLMRKSPVPVWIVKPDDSAARNVVAAIDALSSEPNLLAFNQRILNLARVVAELSDAKLHLMSVWQLIGESSLRDSPFLKLDDARIDELLTNTENRVTVHQRILANWFKETFPDNESPELHVIKGVPRRSIPEFITKRKMDIAVMGTIGRTGIPGFLIGNTAESILADVDTSVLTVKPQEFVTPIVGN